MKIGLTSIILIILMCVYHSGKRLILYDHIQSLPSAFFHVSHLVTGRVVSLPKTQSHQERFLFAIPGKGLVQVAWYGYFKWVRPGQRWQLRLKLKAVQQHHLPGAWDIGAYLLSKGIFLTGAVQRNYQQNRLLNDDWWWHAPIARVRLILSHALWQHLSAYAFSGIFLALLLGNRQHISQAQWQLLRHTGTSHLVAISGLHIGLMALWAFWLARVILGLISIRYCQINAYRLAMLCAVLIAAFYSVLSGFAVSTQRAVIMLLIFLLAKFFCRLIPAWWPLWIAFLVVIFSQPLSIFQAGPWLSFFAVCFLIYGLTGRLGCPQSRLKTLFAPQWLIFIGMTPLLGFWFQQFPLFSVLANVIAIPVVSFLVVPALLLAVLGIFAHLALLFSGLLFVADQVMECLWHYLSWISQLPDAVISVPEPSGFSLVLGLLGVFILLAPRAILPGRYFASVLLLPMFFPYRIQLMPNVLRIIVMSWHHQGVVLLQSRHHALIDGMNSVLLHDGFLKAVLRPALRFYAVRHVSVILLPEKNKNAFTSAIKSIAIFRRSQIVSNTHIFRWRWGKIKIENLSHGALKFSIGKRSALVSTVKDYTDYAFLLQHVASQLSAQMMIALGSKRAEQVWLCPMLLVWTLDKS